MKTMISFILIFGFFCVQAQETDSLNIQELPEIVRIRTLGDCQKRYDEEKNRDEEAITRLKNINFENFFDKIFELQEFKKLKSNKIKILYLYINDGIPIANDLIDYNCKEYYSLTRFSIYQKLWKKENYIRFQEFFSNKIIIPSINSTGRRVKEINGKVKSYSYLEENDIKPVYEGIKIDSENNRKKFYYTSNKKHKKELELHTDKFSPEKSLTIYFLGSYPVSYKNIPDVYFFSFELYNGEKSIKKELYYQYKNGEWILLKENNN